MILAALALAAAPPASFATVDLSQGQTVLTVERGKGMLLRLPRHASTIFVAEPGTLDFQTKSASLIYVYGKAAGETVLYAADAQDRILYSATVRVTQNLSGVRAALAVALPDTAVQVDAIGSGLALSGTVASAAEAADAIAVAKQFVDVKAGGAVFDRLRVAAPAQVNLRVRIAEVNRTVLKQVGVNWDVVANSGRFAFGLVTQNPVTFGDVLNRNTASVGRNNVNSFVDALAQDGLITMLAQPNLTALSGATASFLAGGEFPVPIASSGTGGQPTVTIEFKRFGVSLDFTPTILGGNRINLRVRPEVSQLTSTGGVTLGGFSIPALTVRRAETTIELGSGETFVIAGLLERGSENSISKVPGLGDIPILGTLLRSSRYRRHETELAIIVTPYLVLPVSDPAKVAAPTDGFVEASDAARIFNGATYQRTPGKGAPK